MGGLIETFGSCTILLMPFDGLNGLDYVGLKNESSLCEFKWGLEGVFLVLRMDVSGYCNLWCNVQRIMR